jgi:hypothetical protein
VGSEMIVTAGVDTHTDVHVAAMLDQAGRLQKTKARGLPHLQTLSARQGVGDRV